MEAMASAYPSSPLQREEAGMPLIGASNVQANVPWQKYMMALQAENKVLQQQVRMLAGNLQQVFNNMDIEKNLVDMQPPPHSEATVSSSQAFPEATSETVALSESLRPPPGLEHLALSPHAQSTCGNSSSEPAPEPAPLVSVSSPRPLSTGEPTLRIGPSTLEGGVACTRAEWRVENVHAKLRATCGFPLVSPSFSVPGLPPMRLMFLPGERWAEANRNISSSANKGRQQKKRPNTKLSGGSAPAYGTLKLKAENMEGLAQMTFYLTLGTLRHGPYTCNFAERVVQGCDIVTDWMQEVGQNGTQVILGVDVLV